MSDIVYKFEFPEGADLRDVQKALITALIVTESLHGRAATQLGAQYDLRWENHELRVRAMGNVGLQFCTLLKAMSDMWFGLDLVGTHVMPTPADFPSRVNWQNLSDLGLGADGTADQPPKAGLGG